MRPILVAALLGLTASAQAQNADGANLVNQWYLCVGKVVNTMPDKFSAPEAAVERGFDGCRTEEDAFLTWGQLQGISPADLALVKSTKRSQLKFSLVTHLRGKR